MATLVCDLEGKQGRPSPPNGTAGSRRKPGFTYYAAIYRDDEYWGHIRELSRDGLSAFLYLQYIVRFKGPDAGTAETSLSQVADKCGWDRDADRAKRALDELAGWFMHSNEVIENGNGRPRKRYWLRVARHDQRRGPGFAPLWHTVITRLRLDLHSGQISRGDVVVFLWMVLQAETRKTAQQGTLSAGYPRVAKETGLALRTVRRSIGRLLQKGYLTVAAPGAGRRPTVYAVLNARQADGTLAETLSNGSADDHSTGQDDHSDDHSTGRDEQSAASNQFYSQPDDSGYGFDLVGSGLDLKYLRDSVPQSPCVADATQTPSQQFFEDQREEEIREPSPLALTASHPAASQSESDAELTFSTRAEVSADPEAALAAASAPGSASTLSSTSPSQSSPLASLSDPGRSVVSGPLLSTKKVKTCSGYFHLRVRLQDGAELILRSDPKVSTPDGPRWLRDLLLASKPGTPVEFVVERDGPNTYIISPSRIGELREIAILRFSNRTDENPNRPQAAVTVRSRPAPGQQDHAPAKWSEELPW